jgi:hypothetical protein
MQDGLIDKVYDQFDSLFKQSRFDEADSILKNLDLISLSTVEIITYLTATLPARSKLDYRPRFLEEAIKIVRKRDEYSEGLFRGL